MDVHLAIDCALLILLITPVPAPSVSSMPQARLYKPKHRQLKAFEHLVSHFVIDNRLLSITTDVRSYC